MDGRLLQKQPGDGNGFAGRGNPECEEVNPEIVRRRMKIALQSDTAEIGAYMGAESE